MKGCVNCLLAYVIAIAGYVVKLWRLKHPHRQALESSSKADANPKGAFWVVGLLWMCCIVALLCLIGLWYLFIVRTEVGFGYDETLTLRLGLGCCGLGMLMTFAVRYFEAERRWSKLSLESADRMHERSHA